MLVVITVQYLHESVLLWTQFSMLALMLVAYKRHFSTVVLGIPTGTIKVRSHHRYLNSFVHGVPAALNTA